jgi:hypothetical protein
VVEAPTVGSTQQHNLPVRMPTEIDGKAARKVLFQCIGDLPVYGLPCNLFLKIKIEMRGVSSGKSLSGGRR